MAIRTRQSPSFLATVLMAYVFPLVLFLFCRDYRDVRQVGQDSAFWLVTLIGLFASALTVGLVWLAQERLHRFRFLVSPLLFLSSTVAAAAIHRSWPLDSWCGTSYIEFYRASAILRLTVFRDWIYYPALIPLALFSIGAVVLGSRRWAGALLGVTLFVAAVTPDAVLTAHAALYPPPPQPPPAVDSLWVNPDRVTPPPPPPAD